MREAIQQDSGSPPETTLVWLRDDLRLEDNPLFFPPPARRPYQLLVMYVLDQRWIRPDDGLPRLGPARLRLLWQSLMNLRGMLLRRGSDLLVRVGDPVKEVLSQVERHGVECIEVSDTPEPDAARHLAQVARHLPAQTRLHCHPADGLTLNAPVESSEVSRLTVSRDAAFNAPESSSLDSSVHEGNQRAAQQTSRDDHWRALCHAQRELEGLPHSLPPWPDNASRGLPPLEAVCSKANDWHSDNPALAALQGGEEPARRQLETLVWCDEHAPSALRPMAPTDVASGLEPALRAALFETPDTLSLKARGNPLSSPAVEPLAPWALSPWLSLGCISPRRVLKVLEEHDNAADVSRMQTDQRDALASALIQRERWRQRLASSAYHTQWYGEPIDQIRLSEPDFIRWSRGESGNARTDDGMQRLMAEGWLTHSQCTSLASDWLDQGGDWRLGARWFEHCLLDHDPALHWGEWRRLAGQPV